MTLHDTHPAVLIRFEVLAVHHCKQGSQLWCVGERGPARDLEAKLPLSLTWGVVAGADGYLTVTVLLFHLGQARWPQAAEHQRQQKAPVPCGLFHAGCERVPEFQVLFLACSGDLAVRARGRQLHRGTQTTGENDSPCCSN